MEQTPPCEDIVPASLSKNRIETLTDGIFAIAMTLLVLGIEVPQQVPPPPIDQLLSSLIPDITEYIIAFLALAVIWVLHHQQFHYIRYIDQRLLWLNILALLFVGLMPFSTSLADTYDLNHTAEIIFGLNILAIGLLFLIQWLHATTNRCLTDGGISPRIIRSESHRNLVIPIVAVTGICLSLLNINRGILVYLVIPVIFIMYPRITNR